MPRALDTEFGFGGLNTRATSTGLPVLEQTVLQDMRVVGRELVERLGIVRVAQLTGDQKAGSLVAASSQFYTSSVDTRIWTLGLYWTVEVAFQLTSAAGTQGIFFVGRTTPTLAVDVTGGNIRVRAWDSAGTATTITVGTATTSVQTVQITRSGATLSTRLDNGAATTGSMSATLLGRAPVGLIEIGRDDTGPNYFGGTMDYVRAYSIVKSDHADRLVRNPCPRAQYCFADYDFNISAGLLIYDRSRYENHLVATGTPTETTSLCVNPAPIRGLSQSVDAVTNRKQLLAFAGGSAYLADLD